LQFGDFQLSVIRECHYKLDGGAMYGVVPKTLWNKVAPADEFNRVSMSCNTLLIQTGTHNVLVDTGMGERWDQVERDRFGVVTLVDYENFVASAGLSNKDIDAVVLTHLHFDHVGGSLREVGGKLVPTFPEAKYYTQKGELALARANHPRARASYRSSDYEPLLECGVLVVADGDTQVVPGVYAKVTGGHTTHHQVATFESQGKKGVFFGDLMPTKNHVSPAWVMGYDHYPLQCCESKAVWSKQASAEGWLVVYDHEPGVPWGYIKEKSEGKFTFEALPEDTLECKAVANSAI
jgi:glyoxylase-like metal-dependent hydrolase (beta-lactamase superfamily II)